jgi:hypothetical protein
VLADNVPEPVGDDDLDGLIVALAEQARQRGGKGGA